MNVPGKLYEAALGKHLDYKTRLFHALCLIGFLLAVAMSVIYFLFGFSAGFFLPTTIAGFFPLAALILSLKSRHSRVVRYVFSLFIFLALFPVLFFLNGGIMSGTPTFFIFAIVITVLLLDGKHRFIAAALEIIWYCFFVAVELYHPELVMPFESEFAAITDMTICFVVVSLILAVSVSIRFDSYEKERTELEEARREADSANKAKSEFLAKMSHEIRTPMNAIVGMAELSLRESTTPETKKYAAGIKQASANLLTIINDILDFSKIESGKLEIADQKYQLSALLNDVISIIRIRAADKGLLFAVNIESALPAELIGDEIHIRQILLNLLGNAVKYTKEGYIKLGIGGNFDDCHTATLRIEVADTGIGIKTENIPGLFDEFSQFDIVRNRGVEGTGLGLAITKSLCAAMGGGIDVSSVYGKGSIFTVTLPQKYETYAPFAAVNDKEQRVLVYEPRQIYASSLSCSLENLGVRCAQAANRSEVSAALQKNNYAFLVFPSFLYENIREIARELQPSIKLAAMSEYGEIVSSEECRSIAVPVYANSLADMLNGTGNDILRCDGEEGEISFIAPKARVLVVDDIATNLKVAEGLLSLFELQIDVCESAFDAIGLIRKAPYDIVFMDHMMPEMDGIEATYKIRLLELPYAKTIPIVALTANAVSGVKELFLKSGFNDFLSKPIEMPRMTEILERYIPEEKKQPVIRAERKLAKAPFELGGVDVARGIATAGGSAEQYRDILRIFLTDGRNKLAQLAVCLEQENFRLYATHVHALKSVLAGIGAEKLSGTAKLLELAGQQENARYISDAHGDFTYGLSLLLTEIGKVVGEKNTEARRAILPDAELRSLLTRLKTALQEYNATEISSALQILKSGCADTVCETLMQLELYVSAIEYEEAGRLTDYLLQADSSNRSGGSG